MSKFQCKNGPALSPCLALLHKYLHLSLWISAISCKYPTSFKWALRFSFPPFKFPFMSRDMEIYKKKYYPCDHIFFLYFCRRRSKFLMIMKILTSYLILWWKAAEDHWETWETLKKTKPLLKLLNHLRLIDGWQR